jgi:hypothetical protein
MVGVRKWFIKKIGWRNGKLGEEEYLGEAIVGGGEWLV